MNRQLIFNRVAKHLATQQKRAVQFSFEREETCSYLTPDGLRCAIGCLIPNGHAGLACLGSVSTLLNEYPDLGTLWEIDSDFYEDLTFLERLQTIHDDKPVEDWKDCLTNFANTNHLSTSTLERF